MGVNSSLLRESIGRAGSGYRAHRAGHRPLWAAIDRLLTDQAVWVPLVTPTNANLVSKHVGNFRYHPLWGPLSTSSGSSDGIALQGNCLPDSW